MELPVSYWAGMWKRKRLEAEAVKFLWKRNHFNETDRKRKRTRKRLILSLCFQRVPSHAGLPVMKKRIYFPKLVPPCPLTQSHALSPQSLPKSIIPSTTIGDVTSPTPIWTSKTPKSLRRNCSFFALFAVSFSVFAAIATVFFYPHIFTGSVGKRILLVVPVGILYRTSIISSSTVLPLNPFVNPSLAPLSLFLTYGPDLGVWPDCWVSAEFLRAPIPRKG